MKTYKTRCKHCGREYTFQASGEGCLDNYNDKDYCPTCKKAIVDALSKVPKKFVGIYKEIPLDNNLLPIFKEIKEEDEKDRGFFIRMRECVPIDFDIIELYCYEYKSYALCKNKEEKEWHLLMKCEFDEVKKEFTDKPWKCGKRREYRKVSPMCRTVANFEVKTINMPPPSGTVLSNMLMNLVKKR